MLGVSEWSAIRGLDWFTPLNRSLAEWKKQPSYCLASYEWSEVLWNEPEGLGSNAGSLRRSYRHIFYIKAHQDGLVSAGGRDGRLLVDDVSGVLGVDAAGRGEDESTVGSKVGTDGVLNIGSVGGQGIFCKRYSNCWYSNSLSQLCV